MCTRARSRPRPLGRRRGTEPRGAAGESEQGRDGLRASFLRLPLPSQGSAEPPCVHPENGPSHLPPASCLLCRFVSTPGDACRRILEIPRLGTHKTGDTETTDLFPPTWEALLISSPLPPSPGHWENGDPGSVATLDFDLEFVLLCCAALCSLIGIRLSGLSVNRNCLSRFHLEKCHPRPTDGGLRLARGD